DQDGQLDVLLGGNLFQTEIETPRNDASYGLWLKGDGAGNFEAIDAAESGLYWYGDLKSLASLAWRGDTSTPLFIAASNNDSLQFVTFGHDAQP
ncbi:MAG: hypothetical protein AAF804_12085, partial [Bacteroidota bacterium]